MRGLPARPPRIGPAPATVLAAPVAADDAATLAAHCARWAAEQGVRLSVAPLSRTIQRLGITRKKSPARQ